MASENVRSMLGVVALGGLVVFGILGYNFMVFVEAPATLENAKEEHLKKQKAINMRSAGIKLSQDGTRIIDGTKELLKIEDEQIVEFFVDKSPLCDQSNIWRLGRKEFCTDREIFTYRTKFRDIVVSPDKKAVGLIIETEEASEENTVIALFYPERKRKRVHMLTAYYPGNEFLWFSPKGTYFIYKWNCQKTICGLYITETETLKGKSPLGLPTVIDERTQDTSFVRWVSDTKIEYLVWDTIKHALLR